MFRSSPILIENNLNRILIFSKHFNSKVPKKPHISELELDNSKLTHGNEIDLETINHLERLSLVNFGNFKGVEILASSIKFAEKLFVKNTAGVKPLASVLENRILQLRNDVVKDGNCRSSVMANAKKTEEDYFVAPPGNIPLELKNQEELKKSVKRKN